MSNCRAACHWVYFVVVAGLSLIVVAIGAALVVVVAVLTPSVARFRFLCCCFCTFFLFLPSDFRCYCERLCVPAR